MKILKMAVAGSMESNDAMVTVEPSNKLSVEVESVVEAQFGEAIERSIMEVLKDLSVDSCTLSVKDRGALDCTLRARVETALLRGSEGVR
ncbi:citrate lyase acyl carrier protein [Dethiosulfovibrio peptidovorans]|uniref:citrate lyase acyl carrier protein n=1 Tax=Dethiosulfovibrio peptidovorans TaxID=47055 RepID=UPI00019E4E31|nr:citrate lyase acyl carrier protein [Dethiosulfovibrio peptidovorans]